MMSGTRHSSRCSRASGFCEVSLGLFLPVAIAGLMFGASCGAPDEIVRHAGPTQVGGNSSSSSAVGTGGAAGSTGQPSGGVSSQGGASDFGGTGGKSSAGGDTSSGGTTRTGGRSGSGGITTTGGKSGSGGITTTGGKSGSGGTTATGGAGGIGATGGVGSGGKSGGGADGGVGGASGTGGINPFGTGGSSKGGVGGGRTGGAGGGNDGGGVTTGGSSGEGGASGGAGGTTSTSTVPASGLEVWAEQISAGGTGQITLNLRIDNMTAKSVDTSNVTLRYWYQDQGEGLGTALALAVNYVEIGHLTAAKATFSQAAAVSPAVAGADHYLELSFSGTLAAKGDADKNDQFTVNVRLYNSSYSGTINVANDYSYNGTAAGYDNKITLYQGGKLLWGLEPG